MEANSINAVVTISGATSADSTALSVIYAPPGFAAGTYVVPGLPSALHQRSRSRGSSKKAGYNNELGYFIADSVDGSIDETSLRETPAMPKPRSAVPREWCCSARAKRPVPAKLLRYRPANWSCSI